MCDAVVIVYFGKRKTGERYEEKGDCKKMNERKQGCQNERGRRKEWWEGELETGKKHMMNGLIKKKNEDNEKREMNA